MCRRPADKKAIPPRIVTHCAPCLARNVPPAAICNGCADTGYASTIGTLDIGTVPPTLVCRVCIHAAVVADKTSIVDYLRMRLSPDAVASTAVDVCPWVITLHKATAEELRTALQYIKRHRAPHDDLLAESQLVGEGGGNAGAALLVMQARSVQGTAPGSASDQFAVRTLEKMKLSNAPHMKYKQLFLEAASTLDSARAYFRRIATESDRPLVVAMAREREFLCEQAEVLFKPYQPVLRNVLPVAPVRLGLVVMYSLMRTMSRRIKDPNRAETKKLLVFDALYGVHFKYALEDASALLRELPAAVARQQPPRQEPARSRSPRTFDSRKKAGAKAKQQARQPMQAPPPVPVVAAPPKQPMVAPHHKPGPVKDEAPRLTALQERAIERLQSRPALGKSCLNCYVRTGTKGEAHSFADCRSLGNPCLVPCRNCGPHIFHYMADCPKKKQM